MTKNWLYFVKMVKNFYALMHVCNAFTHAQFLF